MNMARNDPQNLVPFSEFQRSQMCDKQRFPEFHREFKRPRFTETIPNSSSRMLNSSSSSMFRQLQDRPFKRYDELCRNFQKGCCNLGARCKYSHDEGQGFPFTGDSTRMCNYYMKGQFCPFGKDCIFLHQGFRGSSSVEARESSAVKVRTVCPDGNKFWKTRICQNWQNYGSCNLGPNCHFAHGHLDLRVLQRSSYQVETTKLEPEKAASTKKVVTNSLAAAAKKVVANSSEPTKKARRLADFDSSVKINGIYGDWIDCILATLRANPRSK